MASTAFGWTRPAGREPALYASTQPAPYMRAKASAIWLRLQFSTQMNKTRFGRWGCPGSVMPLDPSTPFGLRGVLTVNRRFRVLGCPSEPLDLDAIEPREHGTAADPPSGDVPAASCPLIDKRCGLVFGVDAKGPTPEGRQAVCRRRAGRLIPEYDPPRLMDHASFLEDIQ